MLRTIDDFLFDNPILGFQTISNRAQELVGISCFTISRFFVVLVVVYGAFLNWKRFSAEELDYQVLIWKCLMAVLVLMIGFLFVGIAEKVTAMQRDAMNPFRPLLIMVVSRVLAIPLIMMLAGVNMVPSALFMLGVICHWYLLSCTPLPPKPSKLSEWLQVKKATA